MFGAGATQNEKNANVPVTILAQAGGDTARSDPISFSGNRGGGTTNVPVDLVLGAGPQAGAKVNIGKYFTGQAQLGII